MSDYDVGYGKPPKHTQFKPGQSGNPKGRPKGTRNLKTDLAEELGESIIVNEGGRSKTITKQRAMIKSLIARAVNGDPKAFQAAIQMAVTLLPVEEESGEAGRSLDDQMILDLYSARLKDGKTN